MTSCLQESSTKALLHLFMDGKSLSDEDREEAYNALEEIQNPLSLIEEVYLLSIFHHLSPSDANIKLESAIRIAEEKIPSIVDAYNRQLSSIKLDFAKIMMDMQNTPLEIKETLASPKYLKDVAGLATYGALCFFCAAFCSWQEMGLEGKKVAELFLRFVNKEGEIESLFLQEKGTYEQDKVRASIFLLISLYDAFLEKNPFRNLLDKLDPYEGGLFQSVDVEKRLLCRLFQTAKETLSKKSSTRVDFENKDLLQIQTAGFSFTSSATEKVGIGNISFKGHVIVPSFGPHVLPLGKSDYYGLKPPVSPYGEVSGASIFLWNRVNSESVYGHHWMHTKVTVLEKNLKLDAFTWQEKSKEELCMVFFIRGNAVHMAEKKYLSGGLERAYANTKEVEIECKSGRLKIFTKSAVDVELIPLAGQEYFWSSDFILAYPLSSHNMTSFDFVMD